MEFLSQHFGLLRYEPEQVILFPEGLPAFEQEREFLLVDPPSVAPVIFLQSLRRPELAFITLPVGRIQPDYRLTMEPEDLATLGLVEPEPPDLWSNLLCLAIVTIAADRPPTANLLAPVVINMKNRRARQVIQCGSDYSHQHPLALPEQEAPCS
jgi:flagellar assembly factor FliW